MDVGKEVTYKLVLLYPVCLESLIDILEKRIPAEKKGNEGLLLTQILRYLYSKEVEELTER